VEFELEDELDSKALNIALKQVLQFGSERSIPLKTRVKEQLQKHDDDIIENLCKIALKAQSDIESIFWKHYDYDTGKLKVDVEPLIYEIAPWIDEENYSHIYSQCIYFVMHG
jgi:hypothetical protein